MKPYRFFAICILLCVPVGCAHIDMGPIDMPVPILISHVERIDDTQSYRSSRISKQTFKCRVGSTAFGTGSSTTYRDGDYIVTETTSSSGSFSEDDVASTIYQTWYNNGSHRDDIIYIDSVRARTSHQCYIFVVLIGLHQNVNGEITGQL